MKPNFVRLIKRTITLSFAIGAIVTTVSCTDTGTGTDNGNPVDTGGSSDSNLVVLQNGTNGYIGTSDALIAMNEYMNLTDGDLDSSDIGDNNLNFGDNAFLGSHFCPT